MQRRLINLLLVVCGKKYFIHCGVEADGFVCVCLLWQVSSVKRRRRD